MSPRGQRLECAFEIQRRKAQLLDIVLALSTPGGSPRRLHGW
jgi:hypothetical protein